MNLEADFAPLCESFFTKRLIGQRKASPHTVAAYAHTFRLLTRFAQDRLRQLSTKLSLAQLDAYFLTAFLEDLETTRENDARIRNERLAALRSFYRYAALEAPQHAAIQGCYRYRTSGPPAASLITLRVRKSKRCSPWQTKALVLQRTVQDAWKMSYIEHSGLLL